MISLTNKWIILECKVKVIKVNKEETTHNQNKFKKSFLGLGCLGWIIVCVGTILTLIVCSIGIFLYLIWFKETVIVKSYSPDHLQAIEVIERGENAGFFGPSTVRIKYGKEYLETSIHNDGMDLNDTNVSVEWLNNEQAFITLDGDEQIPEVIEFKRNYRKDTNPFKVIHKNLGYITFEKSYSPGHENVIEYRTVTFSLGSSQRVKTSPIRVYYGKAKTELTKFVEIQAGSIDRQEYDYFQSGWVDDTEVQITAMKKGKDYVDYPVHLFTLHLDKGVLEDHYVEAQS